MHVIEVCRVLIAEKHDGVAVAVVGMRAANTPREFHFTDNAVLEQAHVRRAAMRRLIRRLLLVLAIDLSIFRLLDVPLRRVLRLPAIGSAFEILAEDDRQFVVGRYTRRYRATRQD